MNSGTAPAQKQVSSTLRNKGKRKMLDNAIKTKTKTKEQNTHEPLGVVTIFAQRKICLDSIATNNRCIDYNIMVVEAKRLLPFLFRLRHHLCGHNLSDIYLYIYYNTFQY
jgi:hypothetical protein